MTDRYVLTAKVPPVPANTRIEQSVEIETTPETVYAVLTDPHNIGRYAGGIEGAEIVERPNGDFQDARLELVTKGGNVLRARVMRADARTLVVEDEHGVRGTWTFEPIAEGKVRIRNIIEGPIPLEKANALRYDADVKFQALRHILEPDDDTAGAG